MQDLAYCPGCGRKLESDAAFCSGCGRGLRNPTVAVKPKPKAAPLWPWLLAVAIIVIPLVFGMVQFALDPSCQDATAAVLARHRALFGLLNTYVAPLTESCGTGIFETPVSVSWTVGSATHTAVYRDWFSGDVTASNSTAIQLDQVAAQGPGLALSALRLLP